MSGTGDNPIIGGPATTGNGTIVGADTAATDAGNSTAKGSSNTTTSGSTGTTTTTTTGNNNGNTIIINALALPPDARLDRRVPKRLLLEQGAPTAADRRYLQDGVEEMVWVAALKPTNTGVPAFRDAVREYLEIAVLSVELRPAAKPPRLVELIHRTVPYPVVLVVAHGDTVSLSLAHKRWSQGEKGKVVIEDVRRTAPFQPDAPTAEDAAFLASLPLASQPSRDLYSVYQGWLDRVAALEAAQITGMFTPPKTADRAAAVRDGLEVHSQLERDLTVLRARAKKERQINRRVELNLEIKRLEAELVAISRSLTGEI